MSVALREKVAGQLRQRILRGVYAPGGELGPLRTLGERLGVSHSTVNSALMVLEQEGLVSRSPRRGVRVTKQASRTTNSSLDTGTILVLRWGHEPAWTEITRGVLEWGEEHNRQPKFADARRSSESMIDTLRHLPAEVRGVMLQSFDFPEFVETVAEAQKAGIHFVQIERSVAAVRASSVICDVYFGAYEATRHLIETHGRPVYFMSFQTDIPTLHDRRMGWAAAMESHGFMEWDDYFLDLKVQLEDLHYVAESANAGYTREGFDRAIELFQTGGDEPTSIFCVGDHTALGVYRAAEKCGLLVGRDVFIAGFGDYPMCTMIDPPMTSVSVDWARLAHEAIDLLANQIRDDRHEPIHRVLPVELMIRQSSTGETPGKEG